MVEIEEYLIPNDIQSISKEGMVINVEKVQLKGKRNKIEIPIWEKINLTVREAAEYSGVGINKIEKILKQPECDFVLYVGNKKLVKRKGTWTRNLPEKGWFIHSPICK